MQRWDDPVMVRPAATMADHDIPTVYPLTVINIRSKSEKPFTKEALHHVIVLRHGRRLPDWGRTGPTGRSVFFGAVLALPSVEDKA
jgi:hypothetical protein